MLAKINKLKNWQIALIIAVLGFAVYFTGLTTPFQSDDLTQIVNNVPVHSITNIKLFFEGGTFYSGNGLVPLTGIYFRPLQTTTFSLLYTLFGPHPIYFHLLQLLLCIGSAIFLYLFFKYSFKPIVALFLALIFLVHPLDSQVVYAIPYMQDALFIFFGILALWLLLRFKSVKSLILVVLCLFLSMLSKETTIIFIAMALLYLFLFDSRKRLYAFVGTMVLPVAVYLALRINAVGLNAHANSAPIDNINLWDRILTAPSIVLFYLTKLVFPLKLATGYYWDYTSFNFRHVLLPLVIDIAVAGLVIYIAFKVHKKAPRAKFLTFVFFVIWAVIGLVPYLQIVPLDMTACECWFYFSMAGVLGMIGVLLSTYKIRVQPQWILVVVMALVIGILGLRTALRGSDWKNPYNLASLNIQSSSDDYSAYDALAGALISKSNFSQAKTYTLQSIKIYPYTTNEYDLALILTHEGNYNAAVNAYVESLAHGNYLSIYTYNNLSQLTLLCGNTTVNNNFLLAAVAKYPKDGEIWFNFAVFLGLHNDNAGAKIAISKAASYEQVPQALYGDIMNNRPYMINLPGITKSIKVQ